MLSEENPLRFVVVVNGVKVSEPVQSKALAEMQKLQLPEAQRLLAEVIAVDSQGKSLLLG